MSLTALEIKQREDQETFLMQQWAKQMRDSGGWWYDGRRNEDTSIASTLNLRCQLPECPLPAFGQGMFGEYCQRHAGNAEVWMAARLQRLNRVSA